MSGQTRARPLSISLRLAMLFAAIAAAVFVAVGAYLHQTLSHQMGQRDDNDLVNKALLVRQLLATLPQGEPMPREVETVLRGVIGADGVMLRVSTADGRAVIGPAPVQGTVLPAPVPIDRLPRQADVVSVDGPQGAKRVLGVLAAGGDGRPLRVTLERMRSDRLAILKRYAFDLLGALASGAVLATLLAFLAVRRSLRALDAVALQASQISAQRLHTRLAVDAAPDELRAFCLAFNAMLDRLEEGVQRLSGFAADLAHDLRTPVNALMMQTQVALSRERSGEEYQALLASNQEEYERLARMIENTLFLARADSAQLALRPEPLDAGAELARIRDYFEMLAEDKGVNLTLGVTPAPTCALCADPVLLRRAVNNLVSNAIAHTPAGGEIRLDARDEDEWLALSVANSGEGIAPEYRDAVFDRYYRADPARSAAHSAGLGLAIVRAIMQLHGGSARLEPSADGQTVFTLRFPAQAKK
jgi:two-component system heavy metal sensor histidine kinase CusS